MLQTTRITTFSALAILFFLLLGILRIQAQPKASAQSEAPGRYWVPVGQDISGDKVVYNHFNRHSTCDDCSEEIALPFKVTFYDKTYEDIFLNANGNLTFENAFSEYTPAPFCLAGPLMIAPFYADVDINQCGDIQYYVGPNYLIVSWTGVCHYLGQDTGTGLSNTFQLILTDGSVSTIMDQPFPQGASVLFNYQDMEWTTGHSSGGNDGLGGQPASVGVNRGDGSTCFAYGIFDHRGVDFSPGVTSGVDHLDYRYIVWNSYGELFNPHSNPVYPSITKAGRRLEIEVEAYPNPVIDQLNLQMTTGEDTTEIIIELVDMAGRSLYKKKRLVPARNDQIAINTSQLPGGLYYLSLRQGNQVWQKQIAKI